MRFKQGHEYGSKGRKIEERGFRRNNDKAAVLEFEGEEVVEMAPPPVEKDRPSRSVAPLTFNPLFEELNKLKEYEGCFID